MPQTSLLSFFAPPTKITIDSNILIDIQQQTPPKPSQTDDLALDEAKPNSSRILESLPLSKLTTSSPYVVILPHMPKAAIVTIQPSHLPQLKNITSTLLPVRYSDKFFNECIQDQTVAEISRVALYDSKPVGWIRCRMEPSSLQGSNVIYIQVLGVLAPYRDNGLASALLKEVLDCRALYEHKVGLIYAHVWETNSDAIEWYERRGFKKIMLLKQYYRRLKPAGAWIVRKEIMITPITSAT